MSQHLCDGPSRPMRKDAARNRELLINAAREVFAERGFEASMDEIAHHAHLGVGTAYRHFANKYDLANAIFDRAVGALVDSAVEVGSETDAWDALTNVLEQTLIAQSDNRAIREILLAVNQDDWEHHDALIAPFRPVFDRAKQAGQLRADAEYSDLIVVLTMLCMISERASSQSPELWRRYLPTMLAGLRPDGPIMPEPALTDEQLRATTAKRMPLSVSAEA